MKPLPPSVRRNGSGRRHGNIPISEKREEEGRGFVRKSVEEYHDLACKVDCSCALWLPRPTTELPNKADPPEKRKERRKFASVVCPYPVPRRAAEAESSPMQLGLKLQSFMVRNEGVLEIYGCKYVHKLKLTYKPVN